MMRLTDKLKNNSGESLVELLASVLIGALSMGLLLTLIIAAARMDRGAEKYDMDFYKSLGEAELQDETALENEAGFPKKSTVKVVLAENPAVTADPEVICFGGNGVYSYRICPSDPG